MPMHPDFEKIRANFIRQYGTEKGERLYHAWLNKNGLDDSKPYDVNEQYFAESFKWAKPSIRFLKEEPEAKWYMVRAANAIISMNDNDYRDTAIQGEAAPSLSHQALNMNHIRGRFDSRGTLRIGAPSEGWLPFPDSRVHFAKYEDKTVECLVRIPKALPEIIRKMDDGLLAEPPKGSITHVSIEGFPLEGYGRKAEDGFIPELYRYTALALLEKGYQLPGDPLTTIDSLHESVNRYWAPIDESLGKSLVESLNMTQEQGIVKGANKQTIGRGEGPETIDLQARRQQEFPQVPLGQDAVMPTTPKSPETIQPLPRESRVPDALEEYLKETIELKRKLADQTDQLRTRDTRIHTLEQENGGQKRKIAELSGRVSELEHEQLDSLNNIAELDEQVNQGKAREGAKDATIAQRDGQIAKLREAKDDFQGKWERAESERSRLNEANTHNLKELNNASTHLAEAKAELGDKAKDYRKAQESIVELSEDNAKLTRDNADLSQRNAETARARYAAEQELAKLREDHRKLLEELRRTRIDLKGAKRTKVIKVPGIDLS